MGDDPHFGVPPMLPLLFAILTVTDNPGPGLNEPEGEWILTALDDSGKSNTQAPGKRRIKIAGDRSTYFSGETKTFATKVTHLDPTARSAAIDLTRDRDDQTIRGVSKVEGDTRRSAPHRARNGRPISRADRTHRISSMSIGE
jgi:uncharacterized protein (TIGR03067 family)